MAKKAQRRINRLFLKWHRWLGLTAGSIVLILAVTGCLYVFHDEVNAWRFHDIYTIQKSPGQQPLPLSNLKQKAEQAFKTRGIDEPLLDITTYKAPNRAWKFRVYQPSQKQSIFYFGSVKAYQSVYLNPYNGHLTGSINHKDEFFNVIEKIHRYLLLNPDYGKPIVSISVILFFVVLMLGFVLWIRQKRKRGFKWKHLKINWRGPRQRLIKDLHTILGVYISLIVLVSIITGLALAFHGFHTALYGNTTTNKQTNAIYGHPPKIGQTTLLDKRYQSVKNQHPQAQRLLIRPVSSDQSKPLRIQTYSGLHEKYSQATVTFDPKTGTLLHKHLFKDDTLRHRLGAVNKDIHKGEIGGLWTKIILFMSTLLLTSLPITGFILDRRRRKTLPK